MTGANFAAVGQLDHYEKEAGYLAALAHPIGTK